MKFDFGGWATKNDLQCSDGRIIRHGAFKDCDGNTVPLVWQHLHDSPENVLGHAVLENRNDGVYAYCSFNNSERGRQAKEIVKHGDIASLSIYANGLKQRGNEVFHGMIREVSLVLSGANPGALIDNLSFAHSDGNYETIDDEAIIYPGSSDVVIKHAEDEEDMDEEVKENNGSSEDKTIEEVFDTLNEEQKKAVYAIIGMALEDREDDSMEHADDSEDEVEDAVENSEDKTIEEVFDTLNEEQKKAVYAIIGMALEENQNGGSEDDEAVEHSGIEEEMVMKHNVFDSTVDEETDFISHSDMEAIFADARRMGSLKEATLAHGITNIEVLFPEAQAVNNQPALISRRMEWVSDVLNSVHKTPFSKIKSTAVNLTADEARAKGYLHKGTQKIEEQLSALKRPTGPTTVYKLQKLDRGDVVNITDFDVVAWLKTEMRTMLDEELARAFLIGDGRLITANDKIDEQCIRPIWTDDEMYAVHSTVPANADAKAIIDAFIRAKKNYKGTGSPTLFIGPDRLTELRLLRNNIGERVFKNDQELADELRVSKIVEVELFDGKTRTNTTGDNLELIGIVVNLNDYNVGANKGGEVTLFDDFDLDYNKLEYLIETRCSGALVQPKSALVLEAIASSTTSEDDGE